MWAKLSIKTKIFFLIVLLFSVVSICISILAYKAIDSTSKSAEQSAKVITKMRSEHEDVLRSQEKALTVQFHNLVLNLETCNLTTIMQNILEENLILKFAVFNEDGSPFLAINKELAALKNDPDLQTKMNEYKAN